MWSCFFYISGVALRKSAFNCQWINRWNQLLSRQMLIKIYQSCSPSIISEHKGVQGGSFIWINIRQDRSNILKACLSINICCLYKCEHITSLFCLTNSSWGQTRALLLIKPVHMLTWCNSFVSIASGIPSPQQLIARGQGWMLHTFIYSC